MSSAERIVIFLATGCYAGKLPFAPGTFGSLAALPLCWLFTRLDRPTAVAGTVLIIAAAVWLAGAAERLLQRQDPGSIVIDEIASGIVLDDLIAGAIANLGCRLLLAVWGG